MILQLTSYGNGVLLTKVLTAVSYIVSNSNYFVLLQIVGTLAFIIALITIHHANIQGGALGLKAMTILGIIGIVWSSFYLPQETVIIYDPVNNYQTSVRNVPIPVALPIYLENNIGDGISDLYDAFFATTTFPSSLEYNTTGYGWGPQAVSTLQHISFVKPYEQETITGYLSNCYITALLGGAANLNDLYTSNDLLKTIGAGANLGNSFGTTVYTSTDPGGTFMTCTQAYNGYIVPRITQTTTTGSTAQTFIATLDGKTEATGLTLPQMQNDLGSAGDYLLNTGLDSQQFIAQSAIANSLNPAMQQFAAKYGVSANNLSFGLAQTMYQQQTIWTQSALMARLFLPILHFIMEAIIFSTLPLIFLMSLIPGFGRKAFYFIMSAIMWLTFWSPLMSILNGLSDAIISWKGFPVNVTGGNFNLDDMGYIFNNLHLWAAMIGSVSLSIPVFAYELASMSSFGGMMMASAVTGTLSGGVSSSAQATSTMSGAMGMQQQGQQMMQNQDNKAYDDHGYFDQMTNNNAAFGAANYASQAAADRMLGQKGLMNDMTNNQMAGLGGGAGYGSPSNAFQTGKLGSEQKLANMQNIEAQAKDLHEPVMALLRQEAAGKGVTVSGMYEMNKNGQLQEISPNGSTHFTLNPNGQDVLANAQGQTMKDGQQVSTNILSDSSGISIQTYEGKHLENITDTGKYALVQIHGNTPLGNVFGNSFTGKYSEGGGKWDINGVLNRQQADRLINSGQITDAAKTELQKAYNSGEQAFNIMASGDKGHITGMDITNKQGVTIATDGSYSNIQKVDTGYRGSSGSDQKIYNNAVEIYDGSVFSQVPGGISAGTANASEYKSIASVTAGNNSLASSGAEKIAGGWAKHYTGNTAIQSIFKAGLGDKISLTEKAGYTFLNVPDVASGGIYVENSSYAQVSQDVNSTMSKQKSLEGRQINHLKSILGNTNTTVTEKVNGIESYQKSQFTMPSLSGAVETQYKDFMDGMTSKAGNFKVKGMGKVSAVADPYAGYSGLTN
ncbi:MAG: conjugal transfer protein TraG N-terminal domain-containing protein [Deltaproteobacteria bacterium]|nr:conjugal transfer protein TraG N-terminal domain-containing protein [Deltaproteobacteria bacterium]